ncbi:hypothetical protein BWI17_04070 [Betaproteobacteria bacterium GR16-43]|nr:hypothetical protein BWI17_04070 [Betaproteobacteria bacterium GR16-43]
MDRSTSCARIASAFALALSFISFDVFASTEPAGSMATARLNHVSVALPDGRALVAGGFAPSSAWAIASAEVFDAATATFSAAPSMSTARAYAVGALLPDGRVLVAGGTTVNQSPPLNLASAEIYDPATNTWSATGSMIAGRQSAAVVVLPDGRVLVIGGDSTAAAAEIYDPTTGSFAATGSLVTARTRFAASLLADGRVLVVGGRSTSSVFLSSAEAWDPTTGSWSAAGTMASVRSDATATLLANGKVLVAGGISTSDWSSGVAAAELYDPASGTFTTTGSIATLRNGHVAALLGTGDVVITGGFGSTSSLAAIERYDVAGGTWSSGGSMVNTRVATTAVKLANGEVLVAGGFGSGTASTGAELIDAACIASLATVSPGSATYNQDAASGSIAVTHAPGCSWRVLQIPSWVTVTSSNPGIGTATLTYTVAENTTQFGRGATLKVGDASFAINQSAHPCSNASLSPTSHSPSYLGGSGSTWVSANSTCTWTVTGAPSWITVTSPSTTGSGNATYSVATNPGAARSATLTIATKSYVVSQAASPCGTGPTISPASRTLGSSGGSSSVTVTANSGCAWTVTGKPAWITMTTSGTGSTTLSFTVASNAGGGERTSTFTVAGQSFTVTQLGDLCAGASLDPSSLSLVNTASSGTVSLTAPAACGWTITGAPSWLTFPSGTSGTGSATVSYNAAANTDTGAIRSATVTIAGASLPVSQAAGVCAGTSVSPGTSPSIPIAGGTGSMTVTAPAACTWSVTGAPSWVTITTAMPITGSSTVNYTVAANPGTVRNASLVSAGATHVVSQLGIANYCASRGNTSTWEWIQAVTIAGVTRTTGNNGGYADFTGTAAIPLAATNTITGSIGGPYQEYWRVWIDYNRDGVFSDSELVAGFSGTGTLGTSFTIPAGVASGNARMRISMKWGQPPTPCESFTYGEVEDYTVVIP